MGSKPGWNGRNGSGRRSGSAGAVTEMGKPVPTDSTPHE